MTEVSQYGPKMMALGSDMRRKFVIAMVTYPGLDDWKYAELAGYGNGDQAQMRVRACELLQMREINDAINECAGMRLRSGALVAAEVLIKIASNEAAADGQRIKAAQALLDRVGLAPQQNIHVEHNHTDRTGAALMDRIRELAAKHGLDAGKLLAGHKPEPAALELKAEASDD